jgi:hypothetical protein
MRQNLIDRHLVFQQVPSTTVVDKRLVEVSRVSGSGSAVRGIDAVFSSRTSAEGVQRRAILARAVA